MINYRDAKTFMNTASGTKYPIEGYEDLSLTFRSGKGEVHLLLCDVAYVHEGSSRGYSYEGTMA